MHFTVFAFNPKNKTTNFLLANGVVLYATLEKIYVTFVLDS